MIYFCTALFSAIAGGVFVHFGWAAFHKAEIDAKDVIIDEARQAEAWAKHLLDEAKAKL